MRNLKRVLALAMAMVMVLGMMVIGSSAASYSDEAAIAPEYADAVEILSGMGIFEGTGNGFAPKQILDRASAAALIYRVITGDVNNKQVQNYDYASLNDVKAGQWYTGYVTYANNGGYIKGDDQGNFNPNAKVTGIQVLAIMLRAAGYGQDGEYEGEGWKDHILTDAYELKIIGDISVATLDAPASRELVAQLIFNAISKVDMVSYNMLLNYTKVNNGTIWNPDYQTLGEKVFDLASIADQDVWGRPATVWYADVNSNKLNDLKETVYATLEETPVASYVVKVDECDIAKDMGLKKETDIESLWIDGVVTNSANDGVIDPYSVKKNVGAQGRLTEVYDMGKDGVRIVEINTYLAQVIDVTPATVDKNGHTTDAYVTFEIYGVDSDLDYKTEDFVKFQWALVTVSNPGKANEKIQSAEATAPETVGYTTEWDDDTTTIAKTTYDDADKFILYKDSVKAYNGPCWDVFVDQYGNIIGAIPTGTNYLVIEKIEWKHSASSVGEGYALADIVLADGTKIEDVKVVEVDNKKATNKTDNYGNVGTANISDDYTNNPAYYEHIWTYTVDENGAYAIAPHAANGYFKEVVGNDKKDDTDVKIVNGQATIGNYTNTVVATSTTVFLIETPMPAGDGYVYTVYVGKDEVPSGTADRMCALRDEDGYAKLVVLNGFKAAGNTFLAYVTDEKVDANSNSLGKKYEVYKVGETSATIVYDNANVFADAYTESGIYKIEVNSKGQVVAMDTDAIFDLHKTWTEDYTGTKFVEAGVTYNRVLVEGKENNTSFSTQEYSELTAADDAAEAYPNGYTVEPGTAWKDFNATQETVVIKVTKDGFDADAKLTFKNVDMDDVNKGDIIIVGWTAVAGAKPTAKVIYVLENNYEAEVVTHNDVKAGAIVKVWDANKSIVCAQNDTAYTSIAGATVAALNKGEAANLSVVIPTGKTWTINYAIYTSTAAAEAGTAADYKALSTTLSAADLVTNNVLVLKITTSNTNGITLDDNAANGCTAPALYVVYKIAE